MAWTRYQLQITTPSKPWEETYAQFGTRLKNVCRTMNAEYKVDELCRDFLPRIKLLIECGGDSIAK